MIIPSLVKGTHTFEVHMKLLLNCLLLIQSLVWVIHAQAGPASFSTLTVDAAPQMQTHGATYAFVVPPGEHFSLEQIRSLPVSQWRAPTNTVPNFGYTNTTVWFRLALVKDSNVSPSGEEGAEPAQRYYYRVDYPVLDSIAFYVEKNGQILDQYYSGDTLPFSLRPFESQSYVLPLELAPDSMVTLYVALKSEGTIQLPATLYTESAYHASTMAFYISQGIYFGVVGIMMFYNLILYFAFRAREFLYYVVYAGMMMLVISTKHGFTYQYLWPESPWWNNKAIPLGISLSSFSLLLFTYHFLNVRHYAQTLPRIIKVYAALMAGLALLSFVIPYGMAIKLSAATSIAAIFLCVYTSYKAWQHREPAAKQYIFAWFAMLFGAFCFLLAMFGILPSNALTQNMLQIGLGLEILILSFALTEKIRQVRNRSEKERKKRFQMQQVALEKEKELRHEKEKALQVQQSLAVELEHQVQTRTQELQSALGELSQANLRLQEMCTIDGLTQVPNRRFFDEKLQDEWKRSAREQTPLSVILLDIDHFKSFNDRYGHLVGDECLKFVAQRIEQYCRRPADSAARYGGEEFVLILPNTAMEGALVVANAIRQGVQAEAFPLGQEAIRVTVSLGVATFNGADLTARNPADLIQAADKALYRAKENGRNKVESAASMI